MPPKRRTAASLAAMAALACATAGASAQARPVSVDDLLQREGFGAVAAAPGGRWLLIEQRGAYASAPAFDRQLLNDLLRTRIMVADLARPAGLEPLFDPDPGHGYRLGPLSPDGRRAALFRLAGDRWELGIAEMASRKVHWLPVTPELITGARTLQWLSPDRLAVIARADGELPYEVRWMTPQAPLPARWAAAARGETAVTVLGSGRHLRERPRSAPKRLLLVSAASGALRTLAEGDFTDLEAAPGGRLALLEAAEDIALAGERPMQGPYGTATRRMRLVLADLRTGRVIRVCPRCDMLSGLLSWSPDGEALLGYARAEDEPWTAGRLVRVDARIGVARPIGGALRPVVERRPEVVYAAWWGRDPVVLARPPQVERADWYRLAPEGAVRLTGALQAPPREGLVFARRALLLAADGAAWRIEPDGAATRLTAAPFAALARRSEGVPGRAALAPRSGEQLAGVLQQDFGPQFVRIDPRGGIHARTGLPSERGLVVDGGPRAGVLVVRLEGGGQEVLERRRPGARPLALTRLNAHLAEVELPRALPVAHKGPSGEALRSWLLLPRTRPEAAPPPPLIVLVYPGETYSAAPDRQVLNLPAFFPAAPLVGRGYAVLLPSLPARRGGDGPASGLAQEALAIVDAAARDPALAGAFDPARLGLWGHSFGGYAALSILTQTDRFGAAVAQAAPSDLISLHGAFSPGRRAFADEGASTYWSAGWVESLQGDMLAPPWKDPARYLRNSPALQAHRITTPVMLVHGEQDNFPVSQAEEMFSQLFRQGKDALLVTYWGEPHHYASPGNLRDLYRRLFDWYDLYLGAPARPEAAPAGGTRPSSRVDRPERAGA